MSQRYAIAIVTMICVSIASIPTAFGQDTILEDIKNEIKLLKKTINEQNKRIERIERELVNLKSLLNLEVDSKKTQRRVVGSTVGGWKKKSNWARIRDGMSGRQVISILGKPTSLKDTGSFRTLFYQGEVSGSGFVSGNVKLTDDRVYSINKPVF